MRLFGNLEPGVIHLLMFVFGNSSLTTHPFSPTSAFAGLSPLLLDDDELDDEDVADDELEDDAAGDGFLARAFFLGFAAFLVHGRFSPGFSSGEAQVLHCLMMPCV